MLPGYNRAFFNGVALKCVKMVPDMPDFVLGVGPAEILRSVPVFIHYDPNPNPWAHVQQEAVVLSKDASPKLTDQQFQWKQFPAEGWFGDSFGGF